MRFFTLAALLFIATAIFGCEELTPSPSSQPGNSTPDNLQGTATGTGIFYSVDGSVKVECPKDWSVVDLNDDADIEVGDDDEELYLLVMSLPKIDYAGDISQYSEDVRGYLIEGTTNVSQESTDKTSINGYPAVQYKIKTTIDRTNYIYLHTVVETEEKYHQVLTWSYPSAFIKSEELFQAITESLEEVPVNE